jgi:membrane associated rhomboid family serine protease
MSNVCGMFPFFSNDVPDQFYRLFTSLYLHAGILHLAITIAFQHIFLSDLERLLGPLRTAIIYIASGIAGNLTSSIFVPYRPEVRFEFEDFKPYYMSIILGRSISIPCWSHLIASYNSYLLSLEAA